MRGPKPYGEGTMFFFVARGLVPRDGSLSAICFSVAVGMARDRFSHRPTVVNTVGKADVSIRPTHSSGSRPDERLKQLHSVLAKFGLVQHPFRMILHAKDERLRWVLYRFNDAI